MARIKDKQISDMDISELKNLSFKNKSNLMYKKIRVSVDDIEYESIIRGVGKKAVKLELYLDYERILNNRDKGILEKPLWDKINTVYHKEPKQRLGRQ